jgi:hypothetical protein
MHNVSYEVVKDKLIITVDMSASAVANAPRSASGKSHLLASSSGFIAVPSKHAAISFSVNVTAKKPA